MIEDRWGEIDRIVNAALDRSPEERNALIEESCGADANLDREVRSVLRHYETDSGAIGAMINTISFLSALRREDIRPGMRVAKYEILSPLGSGGMGDVYLARDVVLERNVALKVLATSYAVLGMAMPVFSEARAASSLNHLNIVIVYDAGESDGRQYLAAEHVEGGTLRDRITTGALTCADAVKIAIQIASALGAAHAAGVVHRDLKPENVMLRRDGVVKVVDFGIAKIRESLPVNDSSRTAPLAPASPAAGTARAAGPDTRAFVLGSVPYMSPEQALGQEVDSRSDIFSFGALLYELLTGNRAFPGSSDASVLRAVVHHRPEMPRDIHLPRALCNVVYRCLEKDPQARPQTMEEVRGALERLQTQWQRRPGVKRRWALIAAGVVSAIAGVAGALWFRSSPRPSETFDAERLTHSGTYKEAAIAFDGANVYFDNVENWKRTTVRLALDGDNEIPFNVPHAANENFEIQDAAPGLDKILMRDWDRRGYTAGTFWFLQLPSGARQDVEGAHGYSGAWSQDGSRIAYMGEERTGSGEVSTALFVTTVGGNVARICTLNEVPKRPSNAVTWTPEGKLWFLQNERLFEVDSHPGALPHPVFQAKGAPQGLGRWTADGSRFVFSELWTQDLWMLRGRANIPRPEFLRVTSGPFQFGTPAPSRDGRAIYAVGQLRRGRIMRYDAARRTWIPMLEGLSADDLDYSRGGKKLAYVSYPEGELWTSNADGSGREQITHAPMRAFLPRWSPDGKQITFMARSPGEPWRAYLINANGGAQRQLISGAGTEATPSWSPDGSKILYAPFGWDVPESERRVWSYDLASHRSTPLPGSEGLFSARWSPDGKFIAALRFVRFGINPVVIYDNQSHQVKDLGESGVYLRWSADSRFIYMLKKTPLNPAVVLRLAVDGGPSETVARFEERIVANSPVPSQESIWLGSTPNNEPLLLQDLSDRELYQIRAK